MKIEFRKGLLGLDLLVKIGAVINLKNLSLTFRGMRVTMDYFRSQRLMGKDGP